MDIEIQNQTDNSVELRKTLEDCLNTADKLKLSVVAAKISEALDRIQRPESVEC
jgi:hypothetical protein